MIDDKTRARFEACRKVARNQGTDLAQHLDDNRLLVTQNHFLFIQRSTVEELLETLENTPTSILTQGADNAGDAARAIIETIRLFHKGLQ